MTPTLSASRLILRPLIKATQRQVDWLSDPRVVQFSDQRHRKHTLATQAKYIRSRPPGSHLWAIVRAGDNMHIGNLSADAEIENGIADIGVMIGECDLWGQGYATEAWQAATDWLIDKDGGGFRKLEAGCMGLNLGMRRIFEKTGFGFEGRRHNHFLCNGQLSNADYYGRFP